jgi:signal transduction histidine kinase
MKKLAAVFAIAVLGPSLVLAWLATRSLRDQELIVHSQRTLLHQASSEALAGDLNAFLGEIRTFYGRLLEELIAEVGPAELAGNFDAIIRSRWSQAANGAAVTDDGRWINPPVTSTEPEVVRFLNDTRPFLQFEAASEFYIAPATSGKVVVVREISESDWLSTRRSRPETAQLEKQAIPRPEATAGTPQPAAAPMPAAAAAPAATASVPTAREDKVIAQQKVAVDGGIGSLEERPRVAEDSFAAAPPQAEGRQSSEGLKEAAARSRNVTPLGQLDQPEQSDQFDRLALAANNALADNPNRQALSSLDVSNGQLRETIAEGPEGAISRFVSDGLQILLWRRDPAAPGTIFWVQLSLDELKRDLSGIVRDAGGRPSEVSLALLDAGGQVVAQTSEGFTTDWRQPFVSTEVGEMLPHWEVAAYLIDPGAVARSARTARLTLWMLVPVALIAIGVGSALIIRDIGREMEYARQKTDFVSNVSHELKTPLTSIRMFSDLLSQKPDMSDGKRVEYSGIISREAARLSRLINNLLDFSRMERGEKRYRMESIDAREWIRETVETYRHQIESEGFRLVFRDGLGDGGATIRGDRDALSQVVLNLLSNAEKYGGDAREIAVETSRGDGTIDISVLDRGPGIPRRHVARIFDKFYRADDSLSSGIEGSGLGLTLARQIARAHHGDIEYSPRTDCGSRFAVRLPVCPPDSGKPNA